MMQANLTVPLTPDAMLEFALPGFTFLSHFLLTHFNFDLSHYNYIFLLIISIGMAWRHFLQLFVTPLSSALAYLSDSFTCRIEVQGQDSIYRYLMYWVWNKVIKQRQTQPLHFIPSTEEHHFLYASPWYSWCFWRWIKFQRTKSSEDTYVNDRIVISCWGLPLCNWGLGMLKQLLAEAQQTWLDKDQDKVEIWSARGGAWHPCDGRVPRPLDSVVLDQETKAGVLADIARFLMNKTVYEVRGLPYRRGYLLHGPPGTGKTSLCYAIAGHLKLPIYVIDPSSSSLDENSFRTLFSELPSRCIVMMEDVDCTDITKSRAPGHDKNDQNMMMSGRPLTQNGISLSVLLNAIDGVDASEGRILMMTSNHAEKLDAALIRPGRVDMRIEFKYAARDEMESYFKTFYSPLHTLRHVMQIQHGDRVPMITSGDVDRLACDFAAQIPTGQLTVAELQGHLLEHKDDPQAAIGNLEVLLQKTKTQRDERVKEQLKEQQVEMKKEREKTLSKEIEMERRLQREESPAERKKYHLRSRGRIGY
ncbi:P-loop containing nucleoside triphosphate hydrolase protein [Aspergillus japonicus CBS 114.51]|uniref:P-loop containing nucleoside triphosphate hydrolase protein n=1 Tax=Aspergillus japonicus CBS 114.51 TaxID=1448312 RepID=A0A8T8X7A9_ASPJA|nr:P-loop containing nucleoside triphosphate hydrolase protein [Aspergillus japonicus CBS 114.51]RAH84028.1 P-loop containing nucleoside triphosphate hydrolase protein [Aspergillus japonicus CBS 114.51]